MKNFFIKISKILRNKWLWMFCIILLSSMLYCRLEPIYLVGLGGSYKVEIPLKIRFTRNCKEYEKFVERHIGPMFLPNPSNCPWLKTDLSKDAELIIGKNTFKIPRDYLLRSDTPNGRTKHDMLIFAYPEMTPPDWKNKNNKLPNGFEVRDYFVDVEIDDLNGRDAEKLLIEWYLIDSGIIHYFREKELRYIPKAMKCPDGVDLLCYKNSSHEIFVNKNVYEPKIWYVCDRDSKSKIPIPHCVTTIFVGDKLILINLRFDKKLLLKSHKEIKEKVMQKLNEFIIHPTQNN